MGEYVNVNGVKVPVITDLTRIDAKLKGIRRGSILIISYNCIMPGRVKDYLESRDIKIISMN